ncbi:pyridoxal phosphate-dependent aminotransferase [Halanaerobium sp. Z-7514]|uniref:Aminotransferase n=1 Tax=Halanaerobium polyolivorans TaxID=2886943 RepID=A0AAW4WYM3_9FIRM|nr:pyridoxal phosphate-dependent aminotransferase [Halanaerobium polyolivorans]MCC3143769.1 pyridoxal phosphate-dependent aminotransferase [Halanaerobium polyolivorans]
MDYSASIAEVEESKTIAVSSKANKLIEKGEDIISFGAGEPDFPTPDFIKSAAVKAMDKGYTGYTSASGLPKLKKAVVDKFAKDYNFQYSPEEVIVCNGGKQVLFNGLKAILNKGDEVLIPKPYWVSYPEMVKLAGGKAVFVETKFENEYKLTAAELKKSLNKNTKAIILNSPSNPDGHFYSQRELEVLIDILRKEEIFIISDEIYDKLLYDGLEFKSIIELCPDLKDRILIVNGMSKTYSMTGWRVGFGYANQEWINNMAKIQSHTTSNVNTIAQYASAEALTNHDLADIVAERRTIYEKRRDLLAELLADIPYLKAIKPAGAFYFFIDISALFKQKIKGEEISDSLSFADLLLKNAKVAVVPGIAFGMDNFIRLSFALSEEKIEAGLLRIKKFVNDLN